MKKLFTTILMLCVALVGWSATPPAQGLSIPDDGGWNSGVLTVHKEGPQAVSYNDWATLLSDNSITAGSVSKLILTGHFTNDDILLITSVVEGNKVMDLLLGTDVAKTLDLDLTACNHLEANFKEETFQVELHEVPPTITCTFKLYGNPITDFPQGFVENVSSLNPDITQTYSYNNNPIVYHDAGPYYPDPNNQGWVVNFDKAGWYLGNDPGGFIEITKTIEVNNYYTKVGESDPIDTSNGTLTLNEDGETYTYTNRKKEGKTFAFGDYGKARLNSIEFPANDKFKYIPASLCSGLTALQSITLPNNILVIENAAFNGCSSLSYVSWSTGLEAIGTDVDSDGVGPFQGCTSVTTLPLSSCTSLEVIGKDAFEGCTGLNSVTLPSSLQIIGAEAFHACSNIPEINLDGFDDLWKIGYECFEECTSLATFIFPESDTFTYLGNDAFKYSGVTEINMSGCTGFTAFQKKPGAQEETFWNCTNLTSFTFPPNITSVSSNQALFKDCSSLTTLTFTGTAQFDEQTGDLLNSLTIESQALTGLPSLTTVNFSSNLLRVGTEAFINDQSLTTVNFTGTAMHRTNGELINPLILENGAFSTCHGITTVNFSNNLYSIGENAFKECWGIENLYLQQCHDLRHIYTKAFDGCSHEDSEGNNIGMVNVYLCSHPKTIHTVAFQNVKSIQRVEVVGCPNTCMTEVICENRGFEYDVTHYQTAAPSDVLDKVALLVFPKDGLICDDSPYQSSWDYFVGDYKNGVLITQENILCYYRDIPASGNGQTKLVWWDYDENKNFRKFEQTIYPACTYQTGNGWHEFMNVGVGEIVDPGQFLRTYSRTIGDGPCLLPVGITAYRAVDYKSTKLGYVKDRNGVYYCLDESIAPDDRTDDDYALKANATPEELVGKIFYSKFTVGGKLYLRPLYVKVADITIDGVHTEGYTDENKDFFDREDIYSQLIYTTGNRVSYVPENTGVVLYSKKINEEAFLMLPADYNPAHVYKKFPHTGDRYEEARRAGGTDVITDDDINMLQGSYGTGWTVAPVYPWVFSGQNAENSGIPPVNGVSYTLGHYTNDKQYRNFACVRTITKIDEEESDTTYRWKRLQPSILKENRAFAQIPVNRFDNFNETVDQMPDFTIDDEPEQQGNSSTNLMLVSIFEDEDESYAADGIKTVNTVETKVYDNAWYTLQGVRVNKPQMGGVYIHNGQKVVIK